MRSTKASRWPGMVLVILLLAISGCDECTEPKGFCDGNTIQRCMWHEDGALPHYEWETENCEERYCVEGKGYYGATAICALEPEPEPSCADADFDSHACRGEQLITCRFGYVHEIAAECRSAEHCDAELNSCLFTLGESPLCEEDSVERCMENQVVSCRGGFLISEEDCKDGVCKDYTIPETGVEIARCVLSDEPDETCRELHNLALEAHDRYYRETAYCDQDLLVTCFLEFVSSIQDCAETDRRCTVQGDEPLSQAVCQ